MLNTPQKLSELYERKKRLEKELSEILEQEEGFKKCNLRLFRFEDYLNKGGSIRRSVEICFGLIIGFLLWEFEFSDSKSFSFGWDILISLWVGLVITMMIIPLLNPLVEYIFIKITNTERSGYIDFMKTRKTQRFKKCQIKSEIGIVELRIKRSFKEK